MEKLNKERKRILLLDDSRTQLNFFRMHFTNAGCEVDTASSVSEAYLKIFEQPPDIIVSDVVMADGSGFQLSKIIKNSIILKNIPVLLFTSSLDIFSNLFWAQKAKADKFISKNSNISDILSAIEELTEKYPVTADIKKTISNNAANSGKLLKEQVFLPEEIWMQQIIQAEFKSCIRSLDNTDELAGKLVNMLCAILNYNLFLISFPTAAKTQKLQIYANIKENDISEECLSRLAVEFAKNALNFDQKIQIIPIKSNIDESTARVQSCSEYKQKIVVPIANEKQPLGAVGFYSLSKTETIKTVYFDTIISGLQFLMLNKMHANITNVYDKSRFLEVLADEIERTKRNNSAVSLVLLSFDNYDDLNAKFGSDITTLLTRQIIDSVSDCLRFPDKFYRCDKNTLLMILPNISAEQARYPVERIKKQVNNYNLDAGSNKFTISISASIIDNTICDKPAELLALAQKKLKAAIDLPQEDRIIICNESNN